MSELIPMKRLRAMPWKNGGGSTIEIAASPAGAGLDQFDWRISLATISRGGPFSIFPGIDRTLTLVEGGGVDLRLDDGRLIALREDSPTIEFAGEIKIDASLAHGETTDFNVMTRRLRCSHTFQRKLFTGRQSLHRNATSTLLFLAEGEQLHCHSGPHQVHLARHDSVLLGVDDAPEWFMDAAQNVVLFVVELNDLDRDRHGN